jgi:hypothetical protein
MTVSVPNIMLFWCCSHFRSSHGCHVGIIVTRHLKGTKIEYPPVEADKMTFTLSCTILFHCMLVVSVPLADC